LCALFLYNSEYELVLSQPISSSSDETN
jgi:hypothetical protein